MAVSAVRLVLPITYLKSFYSELNFAAAYRTPNLAELTSNGQHELRYEIGDNNLVPENAYETDLSIHYHRDNFTFDIAGFYNIINNYIFISPTGDTTDFRDLYISGTSRLIQPCLVVKRVCIFIQNQ